MARMPATALKPVTDGAGETAQRVTAFMRGFSIEGLRLDAGDLLALKAVLPARTPVYLIAVPTRPASDRIEAAERLRALGLVKHLIGVSAPDRIIRPPAETCADGRLGRVAAHFFSFGGAAATARWAAAVVGGRIVLDRSDGFGVEPP